MLSDDDAAKDATQEVFFRALRSTDRGAIADNPMAWLYRTTTNLCLNRLRDSQRRSDLLSTWRPIQIDGRDPDKPMLVRQILEHVPEDLQAIAILHYVDELSHHEIATIIGVSRRTVGNRLASFHERVGEVLTKKGVL